VRSIAEEEKDREEELKDLKKMNYKGKLQVLFDQKFHGSLEAKPYILVNGGTGEICFEATASWQSGRDGNEGAGAVATGVGRSKREAEQRVAKALFERIDPVWMSIASNLAR
jgi:dsRNA-specific ribonuclease